MKMKNSDNLNEGDKIKVDIYSRPNSLNGKYRAANLVDLEELGEIRSDDIFFLETL